MRGDISGVNVSHFVWGGKKKLEERGDGVQWSRMKQDANSESENILGSCGPGIINMVIIIGSGRKLEGGTAEYDSGIPG